jgi:hypothetical protein
VKKAYFVEFLTVVEKAAYLAVEWDYVWVDE